VVVVVVVVVIGVFFPLTNVRREGKYVILGEGVRSDGLSNSEGALPYYAILYYRSSVSHIPCNIGPLQLLHHLGLAGAIIQR
jgi:hypothetical protein